MTFSEFQEQKKDCEECPIRLAELCSYAMCREYDCDPPCEYADPVQDMYDFIKDKIEQELCIEQFQDNKIRKEKEKKEIAIKRAETIRQMKTYCFSEYKEVSKLKRAIKKLEKTISTTQCLAFALNVTNEMFGYEERKQVNPDLTISLEKLKEDLKIAEEKYKLKRKEFYAKRRDI